MSLIDKLKTVIQTRQLRGFCSDVAKILEGLEGIGCSIERDGTSWKINTESSGIDVPDFSTTYPEDVAAAAGLGTSEELSRSDHVHRAPHWNEMQSANANTSITPDSASKTLIVGDGFDNWDSIDLSADDGLDFSTTTGDIRIERDSGGSRVFIDSAAAALEKGLTKLRVTATDIIATVAGTDKFIINGGGLYLDTGKDLYVNNKRVVGDREAAVTDVSAFTAVTNTDAGWGFASSAAMTTYLAEVQTMRTAINAIIDRLEGHGLIEP